MFMQNFFQKRTKNINIKNQQEIFFFVCRSGKPKLQNKNEKKVCFSFFLYVRRNKTTNEMIKTKKKTKEKKWQKQDAVTNNDENATLLLC